MWFSDPGLGIYWLTNENDLNNLVPPVVPLLHLTKARPIKSDFEWVKDWWARLDGEGRRHNVAWVLTPENLVEEDSKPDIKLVEFPKEVTLQNLAKLFENKSKKEIRLDDNSTLTSSGDVYTLNVRGVHLLSWGLDGRQRERLWWYLCGRMPDMFLALVKTHLGTSWECEVRNDIVGLKNKLGRWYPGNSDIEYTMAGTVLNADFAESLLEKEVNKHDRIVKSIDNYVAKITPEKIKKATEGMTSHSHSIMTYCSECQFRDGSHLEIHMAREEIDPYLIFSVYEAYGEPIFGGAVRHTWDLISDPSPLRVSNLQKMMKQFLKNLFMTKLQQVSYVSDDNYNREYNPWRLFSRTKYVVDGGVRVVEGRRNDGEGLRDGEWLRQTLRLNNREGRAIEARRWQWDIEERPRFAEVEPAPIAFDDLLPLAQEEDVWVENDNEEE